MKVFSLAGFAVVASVGLVSCGGEDHVGAGAGDAAAESGFDATGPDSGPDLDSEAAPLEASTTDAGSACPDLDLSGETEVLLVRVDGGPPGAGGGTPAPGLLDLTGRTNYVIQGDPLVTPSAKAKGRMQVTPTDVTITIDPPYGPSRSLTASYTVSGTNLMVTARCAVLRDGGVSFVDGGTPVATPFTATGNAIRLRVSHFLAVTTDADGGVLATDESSEYDSFTR